MTINTTEQLLIQTSPAAGVVMLRLNRPSVHNALNIALRQALGTAFARLNNDAAVRVIILCGNAHAFCAGADLNEFVNATPQDIIARDANSLWSAISACRKPVIAAVQGFALGGGCELAMTTDIIIAGASARFGQPEILVGIMPGGGATQRLTRAVGKFHAMRMLLTGDSIPAAQALAMGLVSEVVPDAEVETQALQIAIKLAGLPALALQFIKESVLSSMSLPLEEGLRAERKSFQLLFATPEKTEGMRARLDKRTPRFHSAPEPT
jgi:enoyl-CoA hydratase